MDEPAPVVRHSGRRAKRCLLPGDRMSGALVTRAAAVLSMFAASVNLVVAWEWFEALAWLFVGFYWALLGVLILLDGALWVVVLVRGDRALARLAAWGGLGVSVLNVNPLSASVSALVLLLLAASPSLRAGEG